ncbi:MAG TPA: hypothetical protein VFR37_07700 [Longimicrobium sp.]|nr:hypothetical protein [Longimicrobium sp.]
MWAMLRTGFTCKSLDPTGVYVTSTVPVDVARMLKAWPGLGVTAKEEYEQFGACWFSIERVADPSNPPPAPLSAKWEVSWHAVSMLVLQRLCADGWEPYGYGPKTSAGPMVHLLRKQVEAEPARREE